MGMGLNQEQVHSQEGPGEVVQPELLRDVMTGSAGASSSCCLVSPGLSVSWEHPPSTPTAGLRRDPPCCLHAEPRTETSSWKPLYAGTQGTRPIRGVRSPHPSSSLPPPRSAPSGKPLTHRQPQSPHLYAAGRPPSLLQL